MSVAGTSGADRGAGRRSIRRDCGLTVRGDLAALQAPMIDGMPSDPFTPVSDGFSAGGPISCLKNWPDTRASGYDECVKSCAPFRVFHSE
jgi:hypothetical protein